MKFYIILSIDVPKGVSLRRYTQRLPKKLQCTEDDALYEYDDLGGRWRQGKHRKYVGFVTRKQFDKIVGYLGLYAQNIETGGSITEYGWMPAIAFVDAQDEDAIMNMYATPFPEKVKRELTERDWKRMRKAVVNVYGH